MGRIKKKKNKEKELCELTDDEWDILVHNALLELERDGCIERVQ